MSQNARTSEETRDYLSLALAMNPLDSSREIITLREQHLGLESPSDRSAQAEQDFEALQERREKTSDHLKAIREKFWNSEPERLQAVIRELDVEPFPQLAQAARRLEVVADHRDQLREFQNHKRYDADFDACLRQVLIQPARETAELRESIMIKIRHKKLFRRARRMVQALYRELPDVYALEADWLDAIRTFRLKEAPALNIYQQSSGLASPGVWIAGFLFFAIFFAIGLIASYFG